MCHVCVVVIALEYPNIRNFACFLESDTYQPQSCCKVFDFLVDEAAELELAFLAFDWLLFLRLCAFHAEQVELRKSLEEEAVT